MHLGHCDGIMLAATPFTAASANRNNEERIVINRPNTLRCLVVRVPLLYCFSITYRQLEGSTRKHMLLSDIKRSFGDSLHRAVVGNAATMTLMFS